MSSEFNLPAMQDSETTPEYPESVAFDFDTGEFLFENNGNISKSAGEQAAVDWILKAINTERYAKPAYTDNYGAEMTAVNLYNSKNGRHAWIERTIRETVLADPYGRFITVSEFTYTDMPDSVIVDFTVTFKSGKIANLRKVV